MVELPGPCWPGVFRFIRHTIELLQLLRAPPQKGSKRYAGGGGLQHLKHALHGHQGRAAQLPTHCLKLADRKLLQHRVVVSQASALSDGPLAHVSKLLRIVDGGFGLDSGHQ